jgi:hypothetical protein
MTLFSHSDPDPSPKKLENLMRARMVDPIPTVPEPVKVKTLSIEEVHSRLLSGAKAVLTVEVDEMYVNSGLIVIVNGRNFVEAKK